MSELKIGGVRITKARLAVLRYLDGASLEGSRLPQPEAPPSALKALERGGLVRIEAPGRPSSLLAVLTDKGRRAIELSDAPPAWLTVSRIALRSFLGSRDADQLLEAFDDRDANPRWLADVFEVLPHVFGGQKPPIGTQIRAWGAGWALVLCPGDEAPTVVFHVSFLPKPATRFYSILLDAIPSPQHLGRITLPTPARWTYAAAVGGGKLLVVDFAATTRDQDDKALDMQAGPGWISEARRVRLATCQGSL